MRFALSLLCLVLLAGCCGSPAMTIRNPLEMGWEPARVPGPSYMMVPQAMAPSYAPVAGACSCAPGYVAPAYAPPAAPAAAPCK